jgi:large subunit ribosomal protein L1
LEFGEIMPKQSKRLLELKAKVKHGHRYTTVEAFAIVKELANARFDESIDVAVWLGVDPRHADQMVRGACSLPHGTGKGVSVLVFAEGDAARIAEEAGADFVGSDELISKIKDENWFGFDKVVATRKMMPKLARFLGRILGPRGLMPNPKIGTVVEADKMAETVQALKKGKIDFRVEKAGIIHASIGRKSMDAKALEENFTALLGTLMRLKPASSKGAYVKSVTVSSTMGPGVRVDVNDAVRLAEGA